MVGGARIAVVAVGVGDARRGAGVHPAATRCAGDHREPGDGEQRASASPPAPPQAAIRVRRQTHVSRGTGNGQVVIVGLPDTAVRESKNRVLPAIRNNGFGAPYQRIVINLGPADVKKEGSAFDLPMGHSSAADDQHRDVGQVEHDRVVEHLGKTTTTQLPQS